MARRMNNSANLFRVLSTRRTSLSLTALLALGAVVHAETLQDPTRPATVKAVSQTVEPGALQIEAILGSGGRHIAIVNGKVVREGDRIGTAIIQAIDSDSVRYTRNGRSETARILKTRLRVRQSAGLQQNEAR
jgi:MSHA biogenesis protein MshK